MTGMDRRQHGDDSARGLGPTRARVLALLQDSGTALTAAAAANQLDLHVNSVRFHLDALVALGLGLRRREERSSPGRTERALFDGGEAPPVAHRSYRLLAEMLTTFIADGVPEPAAAAERIGREWGRFMAPSRAPSDRLAGAGRARRLIGTLDGAGFDSHVVEQADGLDLHVSHCPFLEVAEQHHEVVCSVHLGLMRGILAEGGSTLSATSLEPLVQPSLCIAHLAR